ncbi:MAG TPA: hypothetical protein PLZ57_05980 [Pseudobdellovibrionaceae bacterium]|nr:hypothetical protein [Pseudobdellovibrionaceae bacterium]
MKLKSKSKSPSSPGQPLRARLTSLSFGLIVTLLLLLGLELLIRGFGFWQHWKMSSQTQSGRPLILAVGHSHTLGVGAKNEELSSFPAVLETLLREASSATSATQNSSSQILSKSLPEARVAKAAVIGASSTQLLELARSQVESRRPQILLFWAGESNAISYRGYRSWASRRDQFGQWIHAASRWSRVARWLWILYDDETLRIAGFRSEKSLSEISTGSPPLDDYGAWEWASIYEPYSRDVVDRRILEELRQLMERQHRRFADTPIFALAWMRLELMDRPLSWVHLRDALRAVDEAYDRRGRGKILPSLALQAWLSDPNWRQDLSSREVDELAFRAQQWAETSKSQVPEAFRDLKWRKLWWESLVNSDWSWLEKTDPALRLQVCPLFTEVPIWVHVCLSTKSERLASEADQALEVQRWRLYRESALANPLPRFNTMGEWLRDFEARQKSVGRSLNELEGFAEFNEQMNRRLPGWVDLHLLAQGGLEDWIRRDLAEIKRLQDQYNLRVIIQNYHPYRNAEPRRINIVLKAAAQSLDLRVFDTEAHFRTWQAREPKRRLEELYTQLYGPSDQHLNEEGYRWLAEGLAQEILPMLSGQ